MSPEFTYFTYRKTLDNKQENSLLVSYRNYIQWLKAQQSAPQFTVSEILYQLKMVNQTIIKLGNQNEVTIEIEDLSSDQSESEQIRSLDSVIDAELASAGPHSSHLSESTIKRVSILTGLAIVGIVVWLSKSPAFAMIGGLIGFMISSLSLQLVDHFITDRSVRKQTDRLVTAISPCLMPRNERAPGFDQALQCTTRSFLPAFNAVIPSSVKAAPMDLNTLEEDLTKASAFPRL